MLISFTLQHTELLYVRKGPEVFIEVKFLFPSVKVFYERLFKKLQILLIANF